MNDKQFQASVNKLANKYMNKTAFQSPVDFTDLVTSGYDVNTMEDEDLLSALSYECVADLKQMATHSMFSEEEWQERITRHLQTAGMIDVARTKKLAKKATTALFEYLESVGWFDKSHEFSRKLPK